MAVYGFNSAILIYACRLDQYDVRAVFFQLRSKLLVLIGLFGLKNQLFQIADISFSGVP
jgi:hypothetical protein